MWGGGLRRVPSDFEFPRVSVRGVWQLWVHGDAAKGLPPFRLLAPIDMPTKNKRKRLSDLRRLMMRIEQAMEDRGLADSNPTPQSSARIFELCKDAVGVEDTTGRGRQRRSDQLVWITVISTLRTHQRQTLQTR